MEPQYLKLEMTEKELETLVKGIIVVQAGTAPRMTINADNGFIIEITLRKPL